MQRDILHYIVLYNINSDGLLKLNLGIIFFLSYLILTTNLNGIAKFIGHK